MVEAKPIIRYLLIYPLLYIISFIDTIIDLIFRKSKEKLYSSSKQVGKSESSTTYRSPHVSDLIKINEPKCNLYIKFQECTRKFPLIDTLGVREIFAIEEEVQENGKKFKKLNMGEYKWMKYDQILKRVDNLANGLLKIGLKSGDNIVLFSETRPEWIISALACFKINVVVVTQYATLGIQALSFGINQTGASFVFASGETLTKIESILKEIPKVSHLIVYTDTFTVKSLNEFRTKSSNTTLKYVYSINEVEEIGATSENLPFTSPGLYDLAIIMYTSGIKYFLTISNFKEF
jgi:long-chain acyl-CoA synthetase